MRTLLLFDVDGVLIHPKGYKTALCDTVNYFAASMGFPPTNLTFDDIAIFEACGMTNEWDSAAFCVGALLVAALDQKGGHLHRASLDETLQAISATSALMQHPNFIELAQRVAEQNRQHVAPTGICLEVLKAQSRLEYHPLLQALFSDIYDIQNPVTRLQQAHTLGELRFASAYGQAAPRVCESYLIQYDTPLISSENIQKLLQWRQASQRGFVIYTARPSLPPEGEITGYAPEGDLAAELLGLHQHVPLIASGRMEWLARQYGRKGVEYTKPSPVQALAAIGAALTGAEIPALHAAAILFEQNRLTEPLSLLADEPTRIVVFDDSSGGLRAPQLAVETLRGFGLNIEFEAIGVAPEASKQAALKKVTNHIVNDINEGLKAVLV